MKKFFTSVLTAGLAASTAQAAIIAVADGDLDSGANWTADNEYVLTEIVYVRGGTLTIEAGTIIRGEPRSTTSTFDPGALVVTTEGRIDAQGTATNPIIFTTAALDANSDGRVDGYDFFLNDNGTPGDTDDDINNVAATQTIIVGGVLQNGPFLDADPANNPLPPAIYTGSGPTDPIVTFTDVNGDTVNNEYRQLWGGIIILGNAPVNTNVIAADGLNRQFIEGLPATNDAKFGGFNPNDNSGVLSYVSIRHGGAVVGSANEINGLTMGGVGFGTQIDHIDVYCNADDGYEWFGGTVNTKFLTSIFNNDDAFDIDEGFTGLGQFWFCLMNQDTINGDKGGEHDGETGDGNDALFGTSFSIPKTYAVIYNATYIGNPNKNSEVFRIRDNWGGEYRNSIFYGFGGSDGIEFEADGESRFVDGEIIFAGNAWFNVGSANTPAGIVKLPTAALDAAFESLFGTTPSSPNVIANPAGGFASINRRAANGANPVPAVNLASFNNGTGNGLGEPETSTFFDDTTFKGAFANNNLVTLWTTGWTALNKRGILVDRGDGISVD